MSETGLDVVTGALSFTGRRIALRLLGQGREVRTLTGHPDRDPELAARLDVVPYRLDDPVALAESMRGADTFYNTYWVRFGRGGVDFDDAVTNSRALFTAAHRAGVKRIVHISITNPSLSSPLGYFRGKARVEQALAETGLPYTIVRPGLVFGPGDVLVNNMAWLLRRSPVFAIAGRGDYRVRPAHVDDVARLCVESAASQADASIIDAVGPETFTFGELVRLLRSAVGSRALVIPLPPLLLPLISRILGTLLRDVLLTTEELRGLMDGLVSTDGPATCEMRLTDWIHENAAALGTAYASELSRHFATPLGVGPPAAAAESRGL